MTELQFGLIGLGVAAVAGVLAYNKWQERAHRKVAEKMLKSEHSDVLLGGTANAKRSPAPLAAAKTPVEAGRREPVLAEAETETELALADEEMAGATDTEVPPELLDPRLDFIVAMELVEAVPAQQFLQFRREALRQLEKTVSWVGFNDRTRMWEPIRLDAETSYRRLRIGLQLADRRGPVADADLAVFVAAMRELSDELLAMAEMPQQQPMLDQAQQLDQFCADVDLEIGINLIGGGNPFSGTKLRALAESAGMTLGADGLFTRYDDGGGAQFSLQNMEETQFSPESVKTLTTHGVTFLLDVPRVSQGERAFRNMREMAKHFADTLQGALVDDNRRPLSDAQLDQIGREFVAKPQATMARFGMPAGGPQALRLFA